MTEQFKKEQDERIRAFIEKETQLALDWFVTNLAKEKFEDRKYTVEELVERGMAGEKLASSKDSEDMPTKTKPKKVELPDGLEADDWEEIQKLYAAREEDEYLDVNRMKNVVKKGEYVAGHITGEDETQELVDWVHEQLEAEETEGDADVVVESSESDDMPVKNKPKPKAKKDDDEDESTPPKKPVKKSEDDESTPPKKPVKKNKSDEDDEDSSEGASKKKKKSKSDDEESDDDDKKKDKEVLVKTKTGTFTRKNFNALKAKLKKLDDDEFVNAQSVRAINKTPANKTKYTFVNGKGYCVLKTEKALLKYLEEHI